ncbi:MAG TPA: beta-ketoacyl synthase N-terminal-like domain-containing protein [Polyangiales bacterium]|nr:beta-ketoacyl synthase N-terminal-like domain-containing protein [Polyangiales bacterium]
MKPYAITGYGLVSPIGVGAPAFTSALAAQPSANVFEGHPSCLDPKVIAQPMAAECHDFDAKQYLGDKGLRNFDRLTKLLIVSAKLALEHAGLKADGVHKFSPDRIGLCSATAYGSLEAITEAVQVTELEDPRFLNPNRFPNTVINAAAGYVSIWEDLRAPNVTVVDGNCGALDAVLSSETHLRYGRADAFLVGGGEALSEPLYLAFRKLDVLAEGDRVFAPGRRESQGMRLGEGAAYLCLETAAFAKQRGARVLGEIVGYGNAFEPPESEALLVHVSPLAVERAIRMALADAQLDASSIDVVASAASGISHFDAAELSGVEAVFGARPAVVAPKILFGETFGASGALAMACALSWFAGARVSPVVQGKLPASVSHVLVLAVGYYGNASAVILRKPPDGSTAQA